MATKIKLSAVATEQMSYVQARLNLNRREKLWTLRTAVARSLQAKHMMGTNATRSNVQDFVDGIRPFEIELVTFEQKDSLLFRALFNQHYQKKLTDDDYQKYLSYHIEHGLNLIYNETNNFSGYEYLVFVARNGLEHSEISGSSKTKNTQVLQSTGFDNVLTFRVGVDASSGKPEVINFNKTDEHANNYVGIIGKPGSGKTYFVKFLLRELRRLSQYETNFIIFDYAKGDIAGDVDFVNATQAELIDVEQQPIPLNIFETEGTEKANKFAAQRIVEIVKNVEANIGKVQEDNLYHAILTAYERAKALGYRYPDFQLVAEELEEISPKADSLTSVFRPLTQFNLFAAHSTPVWDSPVNRTAVIDIHRLPAAKDLTVFLVLNELYRQLMVMPDSRVNPVTKAREMRTVIVLDEAHHFLGSKRRVQVLEKLIREIRSKGASVMLLSQSPDDYDKTDFDFLALLEFVYVLQCNPSSPKFLSQAFGLSTDQAKKLMREVTYLKQGEAITKSRGGKVSTISLGR